MKKFYVLVLFFFFAVKVSYGSHASGADLTYDYLGNGQYRIVLKFYRDCSGIDAPTSPTVYLNSASCGVSTSLTLTQQSVQEITPLCPTAASTCSSGSTPGVQQYIYTGTVTLQQCTDWVFSFNENARNPLITNSVSPDIYDLYVEATLNNVLAPTNSSPDFSNPPIPYICSGQPFSYNDGVVDINGNTLVYSLINPRSAATTNVPYASGFSPTYPIGSTAGFNFSTTNGQMNFTPNGTQVGIVTVKVTEYNAAGQVIGSVIRDMQLIVINCTNTPPVVTVPVGVTGGVFNATTKAFSVCPGSALSFQINGSDADAGQIVSINSLNVSSLPGGNATLTSTGTNPSNATFTWTPPSGTIGSYSVSFVIKDNACPINSVQTIGFRIDVSGIDVTTPNIRYCQTLTPTTVTLNTAVNPAGGTYAWTPSAGLSSTSIANPVATINSPTTYVVTYTANGCVSRDTFSALPSVSTLTATPALATICAGSTVPLSAQLFVDGVAQVSTCSYTLLMNDSYGDGWNGAAVDVLVNGSSIGSFTIASGSTNSVTIPAPVGATIRLVYTAGSFDSEVSYQFKNASGTTIYSAGPSPATGNVFNTTASCTGIATYTWSPGTGLSATNISNPIATPASSNTYTVTATNASGCSATATVNITVSNGTLNVTPVNPSICPGGSVQLNTNFTALPPTCGAGGTCASPTIIAIGTATTRTGTTSTSGGVGSPYQGFYHDGRVQYLFLASELTAAGLKAGTISSAAFNVSNKFSTIAYSGFNIKMGCTTLTSLVGFVSGLTTTFSANVTAVAGWNTHNFSTNYSWNGTSNLIVEVCYDNSSYTSFDQVFYTATAFNSVVYDQSDFDIGCTLSSPSTSTQRPNIRFGNCEALSFSWTPVATLSSATITNPIATPIGTTTYNVTVKSGACTLTGSTIVTVGPADAGADKTVSCYQTGTATLAATGTGVWTALASNPGTSIITTPSSSSSTVTNFSGAGTYSFIWTSGSCADTMRVVVGSTCGCANPPSVSLSSNAGGLCAGATKTITGTYAGSTTLVTPFSLGTGTFSPTSSTVTPFSFVYTPSGADITAGSVTLKFATNNPLGAPCKPDTATYVLTINPIPVVSAGVDTSLNCIRTSVTLNASSSIGTTAYVWSNGTSGASNPVTTPNTYTVTGTANGCTASDVVVVTQTSAPPTVNAGVDTLLNCVRTSLTLQSTSNVGNATFAWSNGTNTANNPITTANTYTVTATNPSNGCTASDAVVVTQNITTPTVNAGLDTVLNCVRTSLTLQATSNVGNATFAWSNGTNTANNPITTASTYTVTATNPSNGCTASDAVVVTQNITTPTVNAGLDTVLNCVRTTLTLQASSGTPTATFVWSNGTNTANNPITTANTYTVTTTNPSNGCTASDAVIVAQNITAPIVNAGIDTLLNCVRTSLTLQATSNVGNATFAWSNGTNTSNNTITSPTTYTVTATNPSNGCTASDAVVVTQNITAPTVNAGIDTVLNCVRTSITLQATSNVGNATFVWSNGTNTASSSITAPNTYTVTATNPSNGCTASDAVVVTQNVTAPIVNAGLDSVLNCVRTSLILQATSNVGNATLAWSNGTNTASNSIATPNTYTVTATNPSNGCTASDALVITQNITAPTVNAGVDTLLNCVRTSLTLQSTSNVGNATFAWSNGTNTANNPITTANTYTVTATNPSNGCTASDAVVVTQNITTPTVNAGLDTVLNCVRTSLTLQATSNVGNATFAWSNGTNTANNPITTASTYTVTATNPSNGCTASDAVVVTQNITTPTVNAGLDTVLNCVRTTLTLQASSGTPTATFVWSNGTNTANNPITTANTYTVTTTNPSNGCTASDAVIVAQNITAPIVNAGIDTLLNCVRTSLTLQATSNVGNATFAWSNGTNTANNPITTANTYTVTATNPSNGCTASDALVITQNITAPNVDAGPDQVISCTTSSATLTGSSSTPNISYAWSGAGIISGGNSSTASVNMVGTYTLLITDLQNGCTATDAVDVTPNVNTPNIDAGPDQLLTCAITSVNLTATSTTAGVTFEWSNGTLGASTSTTLPNSYTVTVTNPSNGCKAVDQVIVLQDITPPTINAGIDTELNCVRTSVTLQATSNVGNATFAWSNGTNTANNSVIIPTTYNVTATNPSNGCTASDVVLVTQNITPPTINAGIDTVLNCVRTSLTLQAISNVGNATYAWSNGTNTASNSIATPNTYTVTATNPSNGCTASDAVVVTQNITAPNVDAGTDQIISCIASLANLSGSSTTPNVSYLWNGAGIVSGGNSSNASVNMVGTYILLVTDLQNGCTATDVVDVTPNVNTPNIDGGPDKLLTCSVTSINLTATSTTAGVTFEWSDGTLGATTSTTLPNSYTVTVTNPSNGCKAVDQVIVLQNITPPSVNATVSGNITCLISAVSLNASSAVSGVTFEWSDGAKTATTLATSPNSYSVTATDPSNACTASTSVTVVADGVPTMVVDAQDNPCPDVAKGYIRTTVTGGTSPYNYSWSNNASTTSLNNIHGGNYSVTVKDANGCSLTQSIQIVEGPSLAISNLESVEINLGETVQLNPVVSGTIAPLQYTWTPPSYLSCSDCSNPTVNTVANVSYTLYVSDTNGCKVNGKVNIMVIPNYQLYVPNAFTPNGDGNNDLFEIYGNKKIWKELSISVFNRWGEKVFESNDIQFTWDGTFKGVLQNPGVYVYQLNLTYINGYFLPVQKGTLTLIR